MLADDSVPRVPGETIRRLVIKDLVVENFKSYAGRHRVGPFHKTFTAVIGPNGSGKSNVIDAMLFVFGKNAKKIRLEKLSELIHASAAHPNLPMASVTVNFVEIEDDPANNAEWSEVRGSGLSITREVQRTNASQYYIGTRKATQKEVVAFLIARGVDLEHNRFLILQGEVEQIALMKPKAEKEGEEGLLEYFDDLIGTNKFIDGIKEATLEAERCQEERLGALDAVQKVQKERDVLESAKQQTLGYVRKDNHMQTLLSTMCQIRKIGLEDDLIEPRKIVADLDAKLAEHEVRRTQVEEGRLAMNGKLRTAEKNLAKAAKDSELAEKKVEEVEDELVAARTAEENDEKNRKKDGEKLKKQREECRTIKAQVEDIERDIQISQQRFASATARLAEKEPELDAQKDQLQAVLAPLRVKRGNLLQANAPNEEACTVARGVLDDARQALSLATTSGDRRRGDLLRLQQERQTKQNRLTVLETELSEAESSQHESQTVISDLEDQLTATQQRKYSVDSQIARIKAEHKDSENDDQIVQFFVSQRGLTGYFGTLRQLGSIPDKYDVAVGVAGGQMWGWHVVADEETAAACVRLLKQHDKGRATFLTLSRIESEMRSKMDAKFDAPPQSERLYDLIKCDAKFRPVFYHAVRNTLVVHSLTTARELGLGKGERHRVVTLHGELIESTGIMTGGGHAPQGARLRAAHAPADVNKVREQLMELQKELVKAVEAERELQRALHAKREAATKKHLSPHQIRSYQEECGRLRGSIQAISDKLRRMEEAASQDDGRDAADEQRCRAAVDRAEDALDKATKKKLQLDARIADVDEEMNNAGGPAFKALQEEVATLTTDIKNSEKRLADSRAMHKKQSVTLDRRSKDVAALEEKIEQTSADAAAKARAAVEAVQAKLSEVRTRAMKLSVEKDNAAEEVDGIRREIAKLDADMKEIDTAVDDINRQKDEETEKMKDKLSSLERIEAKIGTCDEAIKNNVTDFGEEVMYRTDEQDEVVDFDPETFTTVVPRDQINPSEYAHTEYLAKEINMELKRLREQIDFQSVKRWREKDIAYREQKERYEQLLAQLAEAEENMERLKEERKAKFMAVFHEIQKKLKQMYQLLANGGDAEIELLDSSDPFEGINFVVRPPKKAWKQVSNLSGGEKTLSSLALVFALHHVKPTPVYVMDEIDAALDFRNVSIVARYVLERAIGAQFIIISLRNNMFELAHQLIGICKVSDCTRSIVLNPASIASHISGRVAKRNSGALQPANSNRASGGGKAHRTEDEPVAARNTE